MQCLFLKGNLKTKQNPLILDGGYWVYTLRDVLGLLVVAKGASTTWATWPDMIHETTAQRTAAQRSGRFWMSYYFNDSCWLLMNLGLNLVPLEAPWNYLSIHIKNIQNGLRMRPGRHFWCGLLLDSEVDSNLSCFGPPLWGLEPDKLWAFFSTWKILLDSFIFTPFTMFGRMHTCHVLIILPFLKEKPSSVPIVLEADPAHDLGQENPFQLYPAKD